MTISEYITKFVVEPVNLLKPLLRKPKTLKASNIETPVVYVNNISISYDKKAVVKNLSFEICKGEKAVITGESGKGKSSILNALLGFVPISSGEISFSDKKVSAENIAAIRSKIAWLPQETALYFESVNEIIHSLFNLNVNKPNSPTKAEVDQMLNRLNISTYLLEKKWMKYQVAKSNESYLHLLFY